MTFDINAPLERQRIDGHPVLHIHDSGLDIDRPIVAWFEYGRQASFTRDGQSYLHKISNTDLVTLPKPLPHIITYVNQYPDGTQGRVYSTLLGAEKSRSSGCIATLRITFDPNNMEALTLVEWQKP